jgi:hypothetical protein
MKGAMLSTPDRRVGEPLPEAVASIGAQFRQQLWDRMARECQAMAQHALSVGRAIPLEVVERLDQAYSGLDPPGAAVISARLGVVDAPREEAVVGKSATAEISPLASLSVAHSALAEIIAPATPGSVLLTTEEYATHPFWYALGALPVIRQMLALALISLLVLLGVSLSTHINVENMSKTFLQLEGYPLFVVEMFLLSAASLGSCFQNLQQLNTVISEEVYNPKLQSTYWTRWVMGVISGIILSQLVYDVILGHGTATEPSKVGISPTVGEPMLALLGGYSVDVVHGILNRVVNAIGSFFRDPAGGVGEERARERSRGSAAREANHDVRSGGSAT